MDLQEAVSKDGLPRRAYAYAPDADPATWKLPYLTARGEPDPDRLPTSAAALRDVPRDMLPMVKSKLRQAYRRLQGAEAKYPATLAEVAVDEDQEFEGLFMVLDNEAFLEEAAKFDETKVKREAKGEKAGQFAKKSGGSSDSGGAKGEGKGEGKLKKAFESGKPDMDKMKAHLAKRYGISEEAMSTPEGKKALKEMQDVIAEQRSSGKGPNDWTPEQRQKLISARSALKSGKRPSTKAVKQSIKSGKSRGNVTMWKDRLKESDINLDEAFDIVLEEVGRRNSAKDLSGIQAAHDTMVGLGASCGMQESEAEPEPEPLIESDEVEKMELTFTESGLDGNVIALSEADPVFDEGTKSVVIRPIRAGWGNKRDKRYYTKAALKEAIETGAFDKRKMFADHPTKEEARQRPERSVKDWVSSMQEAWWDEKTDEPRARIKVYDQKYWDLVKEAPEELAFSIRGGGYGRKGRVDGQEGVIVESIGKIDSVDWVTEAGAGGAIAFAESAVEEFEMDIKDLTAEQLKDENPELYEAIRAQESEAKPEDEKPEPEEVKDEAEEAEEVKTEEAEKPEEVKTEEAAVDADEVADLKAKLEAAELKNKEIEAERAKETSLKEAAAVVKTKIDATTLPKTAKTTVALRFDEAFVGEGGYESTEKLEEAVGRETTLMEELIKSMAPQAESHAADEEEVSPVKMVESRLGSKWGPENLPPKDDRWSTDEGEQDTEDVKVVESDKAQSVQDRLADRLGV